MPLLLIWYLFVNFRGSGEDDELPVQVSKQITPFQQVLLMQALKPERLVSAMESFVVKTLNLRELSPPALSLKNLYSETMAAEPILIIISSGSDASEELRELAARFEKYFHLINCFSKWLKPKKINIEIM